MPLSRCVLVDKTCSCCSFWVLGGVCGRFRRRCPGRATDGTEWRNPPVRPAGEGLSAAAPRGGQQDSRWVSRRRPEWRLSRAFLSVGALSLFCRGEERKGKERESERALTSAIRCSPTLGSHPPSLTTLDGSRRVGPGIFVTISRVELVRAGTLGK